VTKHGHPFLTILKLKSKDKTMEITIYYNGTDKQYKTIKTICEDNNGEWIGIEDETVVFGFDNKHAASNAANELSEAGFDMDFN
jgi:hypothetical protein